MFAWILNIGRALPYDQVLKSKQITREVSVRPSINCCSSAMRHICTYLRLSTFWRSIRRCQMKIKSRHRRYLARARENYAKSKNSAANRSQQQGQNRVANRKTHPKLPKHKVGKTASPAIAVRPVPARHSAIDVRPLNIWIQCVRPRPSAIDVRPRPSAIEQCRRSLEVKVFVLTLFRLRG